MVHSRWIVISGLLIWGCQREAPLPSDTLRIGLLAPYASLDPIYARDQISVWLVQQLFRGLLGYDSEMRLVPDAASRWEVSADGQTYRFYLRTDLTYARHPHRHLRARDVVYSWHRLANPRSASPGSYLFRGIIKGWAEYEQGKASTIAGLRILSDSVLEVQLEKPYALFLHLLTVPYAAIVLPEAAESLGRAFAYAPVGLGDFYLLHEERGRLLVLKRDTGAVRKLVFRWYANRLWAWEALKRGEIDAFEGTDRALEYLLAQNNDWKRFVERLSIPQVGTEYLGMDIRSESPFADRAVRHALRALIQRLPLKEALGLDCTPASSFIPPPLLDTLKVAMKSPPSIDLSVLRKINLTLYASPAFRELCEYLQTALAREGITLHVEYLLGPSLREQIAKGTIHLWKGSWLADFPEGENFLILFESSQQVPVGPNTTRFAHPLMDSLIHQVRRTTDEKQRRFLYTRAESLITAEAPVIPLYHAHGVWFVHKRVRNFPRSRLPVWLPLREVKLEPQGMEW